MREDMAMKYVLPTKVCQTVDDRKCRNAIYIRRIETRGVISWHHRVEISDTIRNLKGQDWDDWAYREVRIHQWMYPDRFLPAKFSGLRRNDDIVPGDSVEQLYIVEVEVNGVRIHTIVSKLPNLRAIRSN